MYTLEEIAKACGVSRGTVDRVVHNRGRVSEKARQKIEAMLSEINYVPNPAGLALAATRKEHIIGIILSSVDNDFFDDLDRGINDAFMENNAYPIKIQYEYMKAFDVEEQLRLMDKMRNNIDCLIMTAIDDPRIAAKIDDFIDSGCEVFTVNTDVSGSKRKVYIGVDPEECGRLACGMISLMCHEEAKTVIATGSLKLQEHVSRITGFQNTSKSHSNIHILDIFETQDNNDIAYAETIRILNTYPDTQAIFIGAYGTDGVCRALQEKNRIDIRVVACDIFPNIADWMKKGYVDAAIDQHPWLQGYRGFLQAQNFLTTGLIDYSIPIQNDIVIPDSLLNRKEN